MEIFSKTQNSNYVKFNGDFLFFLDRKCPLWVNFFQKFKKVSLRRNLVPKLIWIYNILRWCSVFYFRPFCKFGPKNRSGILILLDSSRSSLFAKTLSRWLFFVLTYFVLLQRIKNIFDKITNFLNQCGLIGSIKQSTLTCNWPVSIYLLKINNRNAITWCKICSKSIIKTPEWRQCHRSGVFTVNFEHISHLVC